MGVPREIYQARLSDGLCPKCGEARDSANKSCTTCAKVHAERTKVSRNKRPSKGLCRSCPNSVEVGQLSCRSCKDRINTATSGIRRRKKESNTCLWCDLPRTAGSYCTSCWFKAASLKVFNTGSYGPDLERVFEAQGGECYYSGVPLIPGFNMSLDHQVPITKGGESEISNLRWVTIQINRVKNDLSHQEFVELCRAIMTKFG